MLPYVAVVERMHNVRGVNSTPCQQSAANMNTNVEAWE